MDFFIQAAMAEGIATSTAGFADFIPLILIFVVFYFLLIRPQQKRAKEHKQMVEGLKKGEEVVTNGGILGKITAVEENFITLEIAANTQIKLQRQAVTAIMPKGTIKSA
jgi:preprotein translocase subunit YajC